MHSLRVCLRSFLLLTLLFGAVVFSSQPASAAAPPAYFDAILPEDFSQGLFGVQYRDPVSVQIPTVRNLANDVFNQLDTGMFMLGISESSSGSDLFAVYGENVGCSDFDLYLTKVNSSAVVQPGWPVLFQPGAGACETVGGFIKMVPDESGGVYVMTVDGGDFGFGSSIAVLYHYDSGGSSSFAPLDLGEYNVDMIPDGLGGIFLLSEIGLNRENSPPIGNGKVRRYTSAGLDAAWAGGSGEFAVSDNITADKYGATLISDAAGGGIVLWVNQDGPIELRAQRFLSSGLAAPGWSSEGNVIYGPESIDANFVRGAVSSFGHYYATFSLYGNTMTGIVSFDENGDSNWTCGSHFYGFFDRNVLIANQDPVNPGVFFLMIDGSSVIGQHYEESSGNSTWTIGGETIVSGSDFNVFFPDQGNMFYPFENKSSGAVSHPPSYGVDLLYSSSDFGPIDISHVNFNRGNTFPLGAGGDCGVGIPVPDAIIDLGAVAGDEEVDLSWTEPADNGDAIIDYTIEYGETAGFPGNAAVFVDGVNTLTDVTVTGLTNGTDYSFRVFAENGGGLSATSNVATATPMGLASGRRRDREEVRGPQIFLGRLQELFDAVQAYLNSSSGSTHGSAESESSSISYQSEDGGASQRSFSEDEYLRSQIQPQKENLLKLLDLIIQLRQLFGWMNPDDAQLLKQHRSLKQAYDRLFLTRYFHQMTGIEYLERGPGKVYDFDYRDPIQRPTEIVADFQKSILLSYGKACYGEEVLRYAEEIDFVGNPDWYQRYVFIMKPWMDVVLAKNDYVQWTSTKGIDVLESLYLFLFGYCLADELSS
ncbi:MAG: fibronectin type III domain-containing protein [Candidatus Altimarinota bacterium]